MLGIKIVITRFINDGQPGWVECKFRDAWGKEFIVEEKVPVVTEKHLDEKSAYPQPGIIACMVLRERVDKTGRTLVTITTDKPWGVATIEGLTEFDIEKTDLVEI
jgi:hypothetical protein